MIIDYVKSVTERIFAMNSTDSRPEEAAKALFGQVRFHLVLSDKLGDGEADKVSIFSSHIPFVILTHSSFHRP